MTETYDYDASYFNSTTLNVLAVGESAYYRREGVNRLNASVDDALAVGTLAQNKTQLDVTAQVNRFNPENYYKFTLDGDSLKLGLHNQTGTASLRVQLMNSDGKVIADNSASANKSLQDAFASLNGSKGLEAESGDYYVKVSYDSGQLKTFSQTYKLCLYSGTRFSSSYETVASSQVKIGQHVAVDDTMTFSTIDALSYSNDDVHRANTTIDSAINIGWLYENKSALGVFSQLTNVCSEHYYSCTVQKGEKLKFSIDNRTDTAGLRVQITDPTGYRVFADSHGTEAQKKAYAELTSADGLDAGRGQYVIKVSYAPGESKNNSQTYSFKIFSGNVYTSYYQTTVATENADTALLSGSYGNTQYTPLSFLSSYLMASSNGQEASVLDILAEM